LNRKLIAVLEYCPHPPPGADHKLDARVYSAGNRFSIQVRDFQSTLDGIIAYAILFSVLFLSSFASLPTGGLAEAYRDSLLRTGAATSLALAAILIYANFGARNLPEFRLASVRKSLLSSLLGLLVWTAFWLVFGELTGTYHLVLESARASLAPLALCVGLVDGLVAYAYCTERLVTGVGSTVGVLLSSLFGWLLFVAVSVDFAFYLLPVVLLLVYTGVRTKSYFGPIVATSLLMAFFYVYFAVSPWVPGTRQTGYWLMTIASVVSAFLAGLILTKGPFGAVSYAGDSAI